MLTNLKDLNTLVPVLSMKFDSVNTVSMRLITTTTPSKMFQRLLM